MASLPLAAVEATVPVLRVYVLAKSVKVYYIPALFGSDVLAVSLPLQKHKVHIPVIWDAHTHT